MKTSQLNTVLSQHPHTRRYFLGTFPSDECPAEATPLTCFVSNTHPHTQPGQHWIAFYVRSDGVVYYFDPYDLPPMSVYHRAFLKKIIRQAWDVQQATATKLIHEDSFTLILCVNKKE